MSQYEQELIARTQRIIDEECGEGTGPAENELDAGPAT